MRGCVVLGLMLTAATAYAQDNAVPKPEAIGWFVADVRAAFVNFKAPSTVADALGVEPLNLPSHGLGIVVGAHVYPLHMGPVTLGLGAELLNSRGTRSQAPTTEGGQPGPTTETRFSAFSPQASLNFGGKQGWSYLGGGLGWGTLTTEIQAKPLAGSAGSVTVLNYGGGARWFARPHLAVAIDLRFYTVNDQAAAAQRPAYPKTRMVVVSAGIGLK